MPPSSVSDSAGNEPASRPPDGASRGTGGWPGSNGRHGWHGAPETWPGGGMPRAVRLWLPVVVSFLVQVPWVAFLAGHQAGFRAVHGAPIAPGQVPAPLAILIPVLLALAGPLALIGARRFPGPVVAVTAVAAAALLLLRPDIGTPNVALAFAIALGILRGARLWVYSAVGIVWVAALVVAAVAGITVHPLRVAFTTLAIVLVMGLGEAIRSRRERFREFRRTAEQRRMTAEQRERVRIARELHDVLAHSLSLINVQAGVGLHLIEKQPEKAAEALATIKTASKNALDEVRNVLGILRSEQPGGPAGPAPLAPEPDLAGLPALVDSFRAQGLHVAYVNALEAESAAPAATQLALYRICQEALTNVLRHADASAASVYLGIERGGYLLSVTDDGAAASPARPIEAGGGLLGMRERAELLGGSLRATRPEHGGFRVEARIPLHVPPRAGGRPFLEDHA